MTAAWQDSSRHEASPGGVGRLKRLLSEPVMGFLALAALAFAVIPELFPVTAELERVLDFAGWVVVALFAAEYLLHLATAPDRRAYALSPWRLLDLFIILAPLLTFLPGAGSAAKSSPALRILRLVRAILAGTRAGARLHRHPEAAARAAPSGPPVVSRMSEDAPVAASWDEVLSWIRSPRAVWLHAGNLSPERLDELAELFGISRGFLRASLGDTSYPKYEKRGHWAFLNLWLPNADGRRDAVLVVLHAGGALTLSMFEARLPPAGEEGVAMDASPRGILSAVLQTILRAHEDASGRVEQSLRRLEELPADASPESFFERVFALRRQLSGAKGDLRRLRGILQGMAQNRYRLPGSEGPLEHADLLAEQAAGLYDNVDALNESLLSLLDLHLNIASYGMNRFMRLLAIVSALALIPAVIGGLLGMNLADNPWPLTLEQVAFGTLFTMTTVLYIFLAKGWLK